jgi:hypothetical protein
MERLCIFIPYKYIYYWPFNSAVICKTLILFIVSIITVLFEHVIEHAKCLTGYHVFMVSGLDFAIAPRRAPLTARKKGSGDENASNVDIFT